MEEIDKEFSEKILKIWIFIFLGQMVSIIITISLLFGNELTNNFYFFHLFYFIFYTAIAYSNYLYKKYKQQKNEKNEK